MDSIRLVIADDHAVVRTGLRLLLDSEDGISVLGEAGEIDTTKRMVRAHRPDVLVLDLNADGRTYLNPELGARMAAAPPAPEGPPDDLTERELEILRLIALGHTNAEIGKRLYLSVRTVESHRAHIQQKIRRSTRAELVAYALEHELIG